MTSWLVLLTLMFIVQLSWWQLLSNSSDLMGSVWLSIVSDIYGGGLQCIMMLWYLFNESGQFLLSLLYMSYGRTIYLCSIENITCLLTIISSSIVMDWSSGLLSSKMVAVTDYYTNVGSGSSLMVNDGKTDRRGK